MLEQEQRHDDLVVSLYDARVLHVIKKGVAARDQPGRRFDVYSIDYGCYVELLTTARARKGLYEIEEEGDQAVYVSVPVDDYRSIRRAILDLTAFEGASDS